jgi:NAD(P)-dependent dehydrogenase (short-subunit alcohol dehydrogenase family)
MAAMPTFTGRTAVVTGAGSGIGRALAVQLAEAGARLALCDISEEGLAKTVGLLPERTEVFTGVVDVADRARVHAFGEEVLERFSTVDLVINNAGVDVSNTIVGTSYDDLDWIMDINFWGVVHGTKAFLPSLVARDAGTIVNISSVFGLVGWPNHGSYCASKFAVRGFTESLRHELRGTGVTAITVHPGGVRTNIVRSSRFTIADDGGHDKEKMAKDFERFVRTTPEQAAATILKAVREGDERCLIGPDARFLSGLQRLLPKRYRAVLAAGEKLARRRVDAER